MRSAIRPAFISPAVRSMIWPEPRPCSQSLKWRNRHPQRRLRRNPWGRRDHDPAKADGEARPEPFDYDDVIASLAIPPLYKDVERRGTTLWDGLFSVNPPIYALTTLN